MHLWGVAAHLQPMTGGHRNRVLRTIGTRPDLVFKSTRRSLAAIHWLEAVQDCARQSGFAVPRLIKSCQGRLVEQGWTCELHQEGSPCDPGDLPAVAPRLARFHRLTAHLPQRPGFASSQDLLTASCGGDVDLSAMPEALADECRNAWRAVSGGPMTIVHGDLTASNLLKRSAGGPALLDWDECRRDLVLFDRVQTSHGTPAQHRAALAWEVACSWQIEPDHARRMAKRLLDGIR